MSTSELYPARFYHATLGMRRVFNAEEEAALGKGWFPHPVPEEPPPPAEEPLPSPETIAATLFRARADQVIAEVQEAKDVRILKLTREVETVNPNYAGGRKTVIAAIASRLEELGADPA